MAPDDRRQTSDVGSAAPRASAWSYIGVGCVTAPIGFFGGGMIAVLIAKFVGGFQNCRPPEGLPACNTWEFLFSGGLIGFVVLPAVSLYRLRAGRRKVG